MRVEGVGLCISCLWHVLCDNGVKLKLVSEYKEKAMQPTPNEWMASNPGKTLVDYYSIFKPEQSKSKTVLNTNEMTSNVYVEYRKWIWFWGLFLDSEKEVNEILERYNSKGYKLVFMNTRVWPNLPIIKIAFIYIVTILTLGLLSFWVGTSFVFEKRIM